MVSWGVRKVEMRVTVFETDLFNMRSGACALGYHVLVATCGPMVSPIRESANAHKYN